MQGSICSLVERKEGGLFAVICCCYMSFYNLEIFLDQKILPANSNILGTKYCHRVWKACSEKKRSIWLNKPFTCQWSIPVRIDKYVNTFQLALPEMACKHAESLVSVKPRTLNMNECSKFWIFALCLFIDIVQQYRLPRRVARWGPKLIFLKVTEQKTKQERLKIMMLMLLLN